MGRYLDILQRTIRDKSDEGDKTPLGRNTDPTFGRLGRFGRTREQRGQAALATLERRCPSHIDRDRWEMAVSDGRRFLAEWGEKAAALGWTEGDLFRLADVPRTPGPRYQRLARYDQTGLVWLLQGCRVVALTETTAVIATKNSTLSYRRRNKRALGNGAPARIPLNAKSSDNTEVER